MMGPYGLFPAEYRTFEKEDGSIDIFFSCIAVIVYLHQFHEWILGEIKLFFFHFLFFKDQCGVLGVTFDLGMETFWRSSL